MFGSKACNCCLLVSGFLVVCLLGCSFSVCVGSSFETEQLFGGASADGASQIISTTDGGCVIVGSTYSFGAGEADFWLINLDQNANLRWNCTYGGSGVDTAKTVVQTEDGSFLVSGSTESFGLGSSSFWLVKVDSSGKMAWNQTYGTNHSILDCMIQTNDNGCLLVGRTTTSSDENVVLVKTDANGKVLWNQTVSLLIPRAVIQTNDGGYLFAGTVMLSDTYHSTDAWLIKTDQFGNMQWNQTYDVNQNFDYATNLVQNSDNSYTFAGMTGTFSSHVLWVVNVNSTGSVLWNTTFASKETAYCNSLTKTTDQGYIVSAVTDSFDLPDFSRHIILVKLDKNANTQWNQTHDDFYYYKNAFVTQTNNQNYAIAAAAKTDENSDFNILFFTTQNNENQIPDSSEPMTFTSGVTLYSPVNTTYSSKLLTLNLTAIVGMGIDCTINYNIDNQHIGTVPYTFMFPDELHVQNKVKGTVNLPELTEGTHNLTIQVECILNADINANPPGPPFTPIPNSTDYIATWTDTIQFTINTSEQQIPEFSSITTAVMVGAVMILAVTIYQKNLKKWVC